MNTALTIADLSVVGNEPRIQDLRVAERLGFERPRVIRELIKRNEIELKSYGPIPPYRTAKLGRGRPETGYWLNETQLILVCVLARTPNAVLVRKEIISVYIAYRRGELISPNGTAKIAPDPWQAMVERLDAVERQLAFEKRRRAAPMAIAMAHLPIWSNGRRPSWWRDLEVRQFATDAHRQMTVDQAVETIRDHYGAGRTPSRSSLHRYWQRLDTVRGHGKPS